MSDVSRVYRPSSSLLTDLYELTMAYGYWRLGMVEQEAAFTVSFRANPFHGGFAVACGLHDIIDYLQHLHFDASDVDYLATLTGNDGKPIFERAFLDHLRELRFACDVDAVPEGTVVFPQEPVLRVTGNILQAQVVETALLNQFNFQTLIATKAARICHAAGDEPVLEFGLRRAQGFDGALTASRAAFVGGCAATSNVLAGKLYGIPVRGTHAHSWVMCFDSEPEAFEAWASVMPNNCVFLVDTYETLQGVRNAVQAAKSLASRGHKLIGIRLDSGDLAYLSIEARKILDAAGFSDAAILATNDLDEHVITSLKQQDAKITVWGVGTKLATAFDQPALGGIYKLTAIRHKGSAWRYKVKLSEQAAKISTPGLLQVRRFRDDGQYTADAVYDLQRGIPNPCTIIDPMDLTRRKIIAADTPHEDLLVPVFRQGHLVYDTPELVAIQRRTRQQLSRFYAGIQRFMNPHQYPVGLEKGLYDLRNELVLEARGLNLG